MSDFTGQGGSPPVINTGGNTAVPPTVAIQKTLRAERNEDVTIPAGAIAVEVHNVTFNPALKIEVNGQAVSYDGKWHFGQAQNCVDNTWELCPLVDIKANGLQFWFSVTYPASNPIDLSTI